MFTFASVDQEEICGSCNWCWAGLGSTVLAQLTLSPLPSPAPLTACGGVPGASPPWCVCTSRAVTPQTAVATGSAWPGTATATATSGQVPPVTPWTAALPTAACTASAAPVSPALCHTEGLQCIPGEYPWGISCACLPATSWVGGAASPLLQHLKHRWLPLGASSKAGLGLGAGNFQLCASVSLSAPGLCFL